jgi:hypothetical protein
MFDFLVRTIEGFKNFFFALECLVASTIVTINLSMGIIPVGVHSRLSANINNTPGHQSYN